MKASFSRRCIFLLAGHCAQHSPCRMLRDVPEESRDNVSEPRHPANSMRVPMKNTWGRQAAGTEQPGQAADTEQPGQAADTELF